MADPVLEEAIGAVDGLNVDFQTSTAYLAGSLRVYKNGQLIRSSDDDGPTELGGTSFRLGEAPLVEDRIDAWYLTGAPTPGAFVRPPRPAKAVHLVPEGLAAVDLRPSPQAVEAPETIDLVPRPTKAVELVPEAQAVVNLRPRPVRAEEV